MNDSSRITYRAGDVVAPKGEHFPKGIVQSKEPGNQYVVKWPDGLYTKQRTHVHRVAAEAPVIRHHTPEEVAAESARNPGFWIVELVTDNATCLAAVPPTPENAERLVPFFEDFGLRGRDIVDASIRVPRRA